MAWKFLNRALMTTATTGQGPLTVVSAVARHQSFVAAGVSNGDMVRYVIEDGLAWEIGVGTYNAGVLTRSPEESSIGGSPAGLISLTGSAVVFATVAGSDFYGFQPRTTTLTLLDALNTQSYGRSLLETAGASALRVLAELVIGTDIRSLATTREKLTANRTYYVRHNLGTCTISNASPGVVTKTGHGLSANDQVVFNSTGSLPTGLTIGQTYFVKTVLSADTFTVSVTQGGSAINTSSAGSGTHSVATGNNSNNGLTQDRAGAFLTIQKAIDTVVDEIDTAGFTVTIQAANSFYESAGTTMDGPITGGGSLTIQGDASTPSNVIMRGSSGTALTLTNRAVARVRGFKIQATDGGHGFIAYRGACLYFDAIDFGVIAAQHIRVLDNSCAIALGAYSITGGGTAHFVSSNCSMIVVTGFTITLTGTPAFSTAFALCEIVSSIYAASSVFSGSATGVRYSATLNGVIYTNGGGSSFFPGNSAGSTATGGQYS